MPITSVQIPAAIERLLMAAPHNSVFSPRVSRENSWQMADGFLSVPGKYWWRIRGRRLSQQQPGEGGEGGAKGVERRNGVSAPSPAASTLTIPFPDLMPHLPRTRLSHKLPPNSLSSPFFLQSFHSNPHIPPSSPSPPSLSNALQHSPFAPSLPLTTTTNTITTDKG